MYTLRYSEVVQKGCYHVAMVSDSTHRPLAPFSALASCFPLRNHVPQTRLRLCSFGHPFLVRDFDASVVCLAPQEECQASGEKEVCGY